MLSVVMEQGTVKGTGDSGCLGVPTNLRAAGVGVSSPALQVCCALGRVGSNSQKNAQVTVSRSWRLENHAYSAHEWERQWR